VTIKMTQELDYLNARLRGMRAHLLPRDIIDTLFTVASQDAWTSTLRETPYARFLGALVNGQDSRSLYGAVDAAIASRTHRLAGIASGRSAEALNVCLAEWDLQNLLAVTSGIYHFANPVDILSGTTAGGILGSDQLEALAHCGNLNEVSDLLTSTGFPYHMVYRRSIGRVPGKPNLLPKCGWISLAAILKRSLPKPGDAATRSSRSSLETGSTGPTS
jgi:vacuolar-type H+-ATPase subunit C/Vma6